MFSVEARLGASPAWDTTRTCKGAPVANDTTPHSTRVVTAGQTHWLVTENAGNQLRALAQA